MTPISERNQRRTTPVNYLAAMAALMLVSAWLAVSDHANRTAMEQSVLPTALGDQHFLPSGADDALSLGDPVAYYNGQALYAQSRGPRETMARMMLRIGETDHGGYGVYQATGKLADADKGWYLLVGTVPGKTDRGLFRPVAHKQKYRRAPDDAAGSVPPVSNP